VPDPDAALATAAWLADQHHGNAWHHDAEHHSWRNRPFRSAGTKGDLRGASRPAEAAAGAVLLEDAMA